MDRLDELNLFVRVAELGSITAAARSLDVSVSVASQRLKQLERRLGVRLLHRTTRQLKLTAEGAALLEQGRPLLEDLDALTSGLERAGREITGTLRITMPAAFGRLHVSPLLPRFLARHPALGVHIAVADHMLDLAREGLDLAIRIGTLEDSALVSRKLAPNRRVLCAAPRYLRRHGTPRTPEALARHRCLVMVGRAGPMDDWVLRGPDEREHGVRVAGPLESNSGEVIRDAALAGQGIALLSTWHVCDDLRAGRLRTVLPDYRLPDGGIHAVMPQRRLVPPRVRALTDYLAKEWAGTPPWEKA
ncbi:MAG: LysR family transcriptional regulator [Gammaproteobacteria bacterium]|nr:LysR family transcriptional regulator [Gammaproteobacteria bacterium]